MLNYYFTIHHNKIKKKREYRQEWLKEYLYFALNLLKMQEPNLKLFI